MLRIDQSPVAENCQGMTRRTALKAGFLGALGFSLADLLKLRAEGRGASKDKSVILIWLDGGPSHMETYDPKPESPTEYRGPYKAIDSVVPGMRFCELMPHHARHADKMALIRSIHHDNGDHFAAAHWMTTGRFGSNAAQLEQKYPSVGSYVARLRGPNQPGLPAYVGLPSAQTIYLFPGYQGAAYLGSAYHPFDVDREQRYLGATSGFRVGTPKWIKSMNAQKADAIEARVSLLSAFDTVRRDVDTTGVMNTMDRYQQEATEMVLSGKARTAFDLDKEDPRVADRYGPGPWGRYTLMARRLVEAGVSFVTVDMPHWDDHANLEQAIKPKVTALDMAVGALLDDLHDRRMLENVMVVVMGEFGRTPRINKGLPGQPIPGRDHWGNAISAMVAGGGLQVGQVIGETNAKAEYPVKRAMKPGCLLATIYHFLNIDPRQTFDDHQGRPIPILDEGEAIRELV